MAENSGDADGVAPLWPADVIHINEDGWALINRGLAHGVVVGQRLLVVGPSVRELRNLFAAHGDAPAPISLRIRRTYELLEVVYAERECAVAIAARAPIERRPEFYRGPTGELLVWVPLPKDYTWPPLDGDAQAGANTAEGGDQSDDDDDTDNAENSEAQGAYDQALPDEPPERVTQEDERWEEALPLNGVSVGDLVVPAIPAAPPLSRLSGATTPSVTTPSLAHDAATPGASASPTSTTPDDEGTGHTSDWMKPLV